MAMMYELAEAYKAVLELAQSGEIDDEQAIADTLESIDVDIESKAESCAIIIQELAAEADKLAAEEKRLHNRRTAIEANAERIKTSVFNAMKVTGKEKFKTELFSFSIRKNPPKVIIDSDIPEEFTIPQPPRADTAAIKNYLKTSSCSWAHLEQGESLSVR